MTQQTISASGRVPGRRRNRFLEAIRKHWILYLMFLPGAVYLVINNYIPMTGLVVAFKDYSAKRGLWGSNWAGLKNFEFLFATDGLGRSHLVEERLVATLQESPSVDDQIHLVGT